MRKIEKIIKKLPQKPGAYLFKDKGGRILYVGKAVNLKKRVGSHFTNHDNSPQPPLMLREGKNNIADIDWIETDDEKQAFLLENELIKKYKPRYNIQWQDDKSYFWVMITNEEWPRVKIVHKRQVTSDKEILTGPFVNGRELRQLLRALRKIFPYRTCKNSYDKPCLQWHLGLCPAHRPFSVIPAKAGIQNSESPRIKYRASLIKPGMTMDKKQKDQHLNSLHALSQFLRLYAGEPMRIEAYDISNIHGVWATGSMIVFYGNKPSKNDYRKFKIRYENSHGRIRTAPDIAFGEVKGGRVSRGRRPSERFSHAANDTAMIKEVLRRRFGHPEWPTPDLILIDGGRAQLHAARLSLVTCHLSLPIIALAKREEEIYTEYSDKTLKLSALQTELRLIFQAIRDEAHRFAIFYYRHLHRKHIRT